MAGLLSAHLARSARTPFAFGAADCGTFVSDWVAACGGGDLAAPFRGRYESYLGAYQMTGRGGVQTAVARRARALGLVRTRAPVDGDIAIIARPRGAVTSVPVRAMWISIGAPVVLAAIRVRRGWVAKSDRGIVMLPDGRVRVLAAWSVPWPR